METIKKITRLDDFKLAADKYSTYDGYEVETGEQRIYVLIENHSSCCEEWGHFSTPDNPKDFVGATLLKVEIVDTAMNKEVWNEKHPYGLDGGNAVFVNFETDRGTFQLTAYNSHNGYYGHEVKVISRDLNLDTTV